MLSWYKNLKYLVVHKYYVYRAGRLLGLSRKQLLAHDLSKLLPDEFLAYARYFHSVKLTKKQTKSAEWKFKQAWKLHVERNAHHAEYWTRQGRRGQDMPDKYIREMVADWYGAGMALGQGTEHLRRWWNLNRVRVMTLIGKPNAEKAEEYVSALEHLLGS